MDKEKAISTSLTTSFSAIQIAENSDRIKDIPDSDRNKDHVRRAFAYIVTLIGFNLSKTSKEEISIHLNFIRNNFPNLRVGELQLAFEIGVRGDLTNEKGVTLDLTHYQSFNSIYLSTVIKAYLRYKARQNTINPPKEDVKLLAPKSLDKKEATINEFEDFKIKDKVLDPFNLIYLYLVQEGVLNITVKRKHEFYRAAQVELNRALKTDVNSQNRLSIANQVEKILTEKGNLKVKAEAMRLALEDYFRGLIALDMHVKDKLL